MPARRHALATLLAPVVIGALVSVGGCAAAPAARVVRTDPPTLFRSPAYSNAVGVDLPPGRLVFVAGQVARDSAGRLVGAGDVGAQTAAVFENLRRALAANGAGLDDLLKVTIFVTDVRALAAIAAVRQRYLREALPASTLVEVSRLADPGWLVEIEAVAWAPRR